MWREADQTDLTHIPQLVETEIKYLWRLYFWDGPLNGMAQYGARKAWFDFHHMDEEGTHYYYVLYVLTNEQIEQAELWHHAEEKYEWNGPRFPNTKPLGWFIDGHNGDFYGIKIHPPDTPTKGNGE